MDIVVSLAALLTIGVLALRFGRDGRVRSQEHERAALGVTGTDLEPGRGAPATGHANSSVRADYPTLAFLESALGQPHGALTGAADADRLEAQVRALTAEYWGDAVWTTGAVSVAAFDRVLAELAPCLLAGGGPSHPIDLSTAVAVAGVAPPVQDVPADAAA